MRMAIPVEPFYRTEKRVQERTNVPISKFGPVLRGSGCPLQGNSGAPLLSLRAAAG